MPLECKDTCRFYHISLKGAKYEGIAYRCNVCDCYLQLSFSVVMPTPSGLNVRRCGCCHAQVKLRPNSSRQNRHKAHTIAKSLNRIEVEVLP